MKKKECKADAFARYANMLENLDLDKLKYLADFITYYSSEHKRALFNQNEYKLQENPIADAFVQRGIFISDFEVWQQEHDDWKNPSNFPTDICTKRTYYLSEDMQNIVDRYGIDWKEIASMSLE